MTQKIDENITELIFEDDREILKVAKKSITPKCDFWFKKIFGEHKDICKDFIESITGLHINTLEYGNTESLGNSYRTKKILFDVNVKLDNGMRVNIEMQVEDLDENVDRFALYATRYHSDQLKSGQTYKDVTKTIVIHVFDYIFLDKERYKNHINLYQLLHVTEHTLLSDTLDVFVIELPKLPEIWHNENEKWLSWLNDRENAVKKGVTMQNQHIANAESIYNTIANDPVTQMEYVSVLKAEYRERAKIHDAKMEEKREIAKNLKELCATLDMIIKATGLTKEEIEKL